MWHGLALLHRRVVTSEGKVDGSVERTGHATFGDSGIVCEVRLEFGQLFDGETHQQSNNMLS